MLQNEFIIYVSDNFIKKLNIVVYFYIDGMIIYIKNLKLLIVILFYEHNIENENTDYWN